VTAARKSRAPETDHDDEITIERRVRVPVDAGRREGPITTRMTKIDSRLLAIARGELDPDDPFGGLIPIYDDDRDDAEEIDSDWLVLVPELPPTVVPPPSNEGIFGDIVPKARMRVAEMLELPLDERCALFVSQVDGKRTLEEVIDACGLDELAGLEVIDDLLRYAVIELG
jgi:hypothetical protein